MGRSKSCRSTHTSNLEVNIHRPQKYSLLTVLSPQITSEELKTERVKRKSSVQERRAFITEMEPGLLFWKQPAKHILQSCGQSPRQAVNMQKVHPGLDTCSCIPHTQTETQHMFYIWILLDTFCVITQGHILHETYRTTCNSVLYV